MSEIIKPPQPLDITLGQQIIFLGGTIDNGASEDWQQVVGQYLVDNYECVVLNPRRDNWDSTWVQDISNDQFRQQVQWELDGMDLANIIIINLTSGSLSPISLLELGLQATRRVLLFVACAPDFWRRGNVQVICDRYNIPLYDDIDSLLAGEAIYFRKKK